MDFVTPTMSNHAGATVNGITVNFTNAKDTSDAVTLINNATAGVIDVVASAHTDGDLILKSASGLTITMTGTAASNGTGAGAFVNAAVNLDGSAVTGGTVGEGIVSNRGFISLTSQDGAAISIEDGARDRDGETGADRIGFEKQNEISQDTAGVSVSSVSAANTSLTSLDNQ